MEAETVKEKQKLTRFGCLLDVCTGRMSVGCVHCAVKCLVKR